jgi:hypothetical protein
VATPVKKAVPMCCVTIGYQHYLMPADKGMKVVELMQSAFECEQRYEDRGMQYQVGEPPQRVVFEMVRPGQIVQPRPAAPAGPLLLSRPEPPVTFRGDRK